MIRRNLVLILRGKEVVEVHMKQVILLSPLLFHAVKSGYILQGIKQPMNHLLVIDDLKLVVINSNQLDSRMYNVRVCINYIRSHLNLIIVLSCARYEDSKNRR